MREMTQMVSSFEHLVLIIGVIGIVAWLIPIAIVLFVPYLARREDRKSTS